MEFSTDFDPNSVQVIDQQMRNALERDFASVKEGQLTDVPVTESDNVLRLLEEYVKNLGWMLFWKWKQDIKPLDKLTTLRQMKLCELVPERTDPYPADVMNQPMPVMLAHVYKQIVQAQLVACHLRDFFDTFCGLILLYAEERAQFHSLKRYELAQPQKTQVSQRQYSNANAGTKPTGQLKLNNGTSAYTSEFTRRLRQWKLHPKANFERGLRITPPSMVYGIPHLLRLLNKCETIMTEMNTPAEMQVMIAKHLHGLKEYVLAREYHMTIGLPFPTNETSQESEPEELPDFSIVEDDTEEEEEKEELLDI